MPIMKAVLFALAFAGTAIGSGCNADNCARAVTGTRLGPASISAHRSDCSSFMLTTVRVGW